MLLHCLSSNDACCRCQSGALIFYFHLAYSLSISLFIVASSIYSQQSEERGTTGHDGRRSSLNIQIDRNNTASLLPAIPLNRKIPCIDHCASRVAEKLIRLSLESVMHLYSTDQTQCLELVNNFINNLVSRNVDQAPMLQVVNGKIQVSLIFEEEVHC